MCLQIFIHAFRHFRWPGRGGANDPDFSIDLSRSRATLRTTEILYIFRGNCYTSQGDPDSSFHTGKQTSFCRKLNYKDHHECSFCIFDLFPVKTRNTYKKYATNAISWRKKFDFSEILFFRNSKNWGCDALLLVFVNEIKSSILLYLWNYRRRWLFCRTP